MRVLIDEDEKDMAEVLKAGLEEENHLVSLAFDGLSGLEGGAGVRLRRDCSGCNASKTRWI
jgi:DNA-binding response OmpR family regulator